MIDFEVENFISTKILFENYFKNDHSYGKKNNKACFKEDRVLIEERTESVEIEVEPPSSSAVAIPLKWLFIKIICASFNLIFLSSSYSNFEIILFCSSSVKS